MGFEKLVDSLRGILHLQDDQEYESPVEYQPIPDPVSPWRVLTGDSLRERALTAEMEESFNPRYLGASDLLPLADAGGRWFSEPNENEEGVKQSSIWLDPEIWQPTLSEFELLANYFNNEGISFLVRSHDADTHSAYDHQGYIILTPVLIDRHGFGKSGDISYGLSSTGRVCVGSVKTGFRDMGYLNPRRKRKQVVSDLMDALKESWEDAGSSH